MKKLLALMMTFLSLVITLTITSCSDYRHRAKLDAEKADSIWFTEMLEKTLPSYENKQETFESTSLILREQMIQNDLRIRDSIFTHMQPEVLSNVCVTLFKTKSQISVTDVIAEYRKYKSVYDNLDLQRAAEEIRKFKAIQEDISKNKIAASEITKHDTIYVK